MAKSIKTEWLGTRVDKQFDSEVKAYIAATGSNQAELLRDAVSEFMINHPVKPKRETPNLKPGV